MSRGARPSGTARRRLLIVVALLCAAAGALVFYRHGTFGFEKDVKPPLVVALAGPFSGPSQRVGQETEAATRILLDRVNAGGGINGQRIELKLFDDANDPARAATVAADIVKDRGIVAVIGHSLSTTSLAAAPIYQAAGLPAVTPAATTPALTENHDVYYSTIYSDRIQGRFMAEYVRRGLRSGAATAIVAPGQYAGMLAQSFIDHASRIGLVVTTERIDQASVARPEAVSAMAASLAAATGEGTTVAVFAQRADAFEIIRALRDAKLKSPILGPDSIGDERFAGQFTKLPGEIAQPGFYTSNLFVSVPFIRTIANAEARQLFEPMEKAMGPLQSWIAPYAYDAAKLLVEVFRRRAPDGGSPAFIRQAALAELAGLKDGGIVIEGANGPLRFDRNGAAERPISIGVFQGGLVSSLLQLQMDPVDRTAPLDVKTIVYGGIQPVRIDKVDRLAATASVIFDIWFRYQGVMDLSALDFDNAVEPIKLGAPVQESEYAGVHYRQYRAKGTFKLNFTRSAESPYHHLFQVAVHQSRQANTSMVFVPDALGLPAVAGPRLASHVMANLTETSGWRFTDAELLAYFAPMSAKGDPAFLSRRMSVFHQPGLLFTGELATAAPSWKDFVDVDLAAGAMVAILLAIALFRLSTGKWPLADKPRMKFMAFAAVALMLLAVVEASAVQRIGGSFRPLMQGPVQVVLDCLWWLVPALLVNVAIHLFVWNPLEAATQQAVPRVIKTLVGFVVLALAVFGIIAFIFDQQITSLLATSGLIAMIIGLAIQSNISHIFTGIALNIERPFRPGDWIKVGDTTGKVVDISWRSTRLETFANTTISIPNSTVGNGKIENFTYPNPRFFIFQILYFGLEHDPARITALIHDALKLVKSVDGRERLGVNWVKFNGVETHGQKFLVAFDCIDRMLKNSQEHAVLVSIYQVLARCGVHPTTSNVTINYTATPDIGAQALGADHLVRNAAIFEPLSAQDKAELAAHAIKREFSPGEIIVRQGDSGDSLFLISEGVVEVQINVEGKEAPVEVARLGPGSYFGEMALLTGAPRATTVKAMEYCRLFEVSKQALQPMIEQSNQLTESLSNILAERQIQNQTRLSSNVEFEQAKRELSNGLFRRIRGFFPARRDTAAD